MKWLFFAVFVAFPKDASACWDGWSATVGRVHVDRANADDWSPAFVKRVATWLARIDALGANVEVQSYEWNGSLPDLYARFAHGKISTATAKTPVYTLQIFAGTEANATRVADGVNALSEISEGFISVGGFPAVNPKAHVIFSGHGTIFRVLVGAYLDAAEALETRATIAREIGWIGFVREL